MINIEALYQQLGEMSEADPLIDAMYDLSDHTLLTKSSGELLSLVGKVYELFAYRKAREIFSTSVVISPSQMRELYEYLFSTRGSRDGILGEIIPDGLALEPGKNDNYRITSILEYKANREIPNIDRFYSQLFCFSRPALMASSLDIHDPFGRKQLGYFLGEIIPEIKIHSVSLNPKYQIRYIVPNNSELSPKSILNQPDRLFFPPRISHEDYSSLKPVIQQKLKVDHCDFDSFQFAGMIHRLSNEIVADRNQRYSS